MLLVVRIMQCPIFSGMPKMRTRPCHTTQAFTPGPFPPELAHDERKPSAARHRSRRHHEAAAGKPRRRLADRRDREESIIGAANRRGSPNALARHPELIASLRRPRRAAALALRFTILTVARAETARWAEFSSRQRNVARTLAQAFSDARGNGCSARGGRMPRPSKYLTVTYVFKSGRRPTNAEIFQYIGVEGGSGTALICMSLGAGCLAAEAPIYPPFGARRRREIGAPTPATSRNGC